jgi:hypothetical protein
VDASAAEADATTIKQPFREVTCANKKVVVRPRGGDRGGNDRGGWMQFIGE